MSIKTFIHGINHDKDGVRSTKHGSLIVSTLQTRRHDVIHAMHPGPHRRFYSSKLATSAGATALNVNGSVTPVSFKINADPAYYRVISEIITYFEDAQMNAGTNEVRRFGSAAAAPGLTNGLIYRVSYSGVISTVFPENIKNISNYIVYSDTTNIVDGVSAGVDIFVSKLTLAQPIELVPERQDYIEVYVQDDLSAVDTMYCVARGYEEDN